MKRIYLVLTYMIMALALCGCMASSTSTSKTSVTKPTVSEKTTKHMAIVNSVNVGTKELSVYSCEADCNEILNYTSSTLAFTKAGKAMTMAQFEPGDIVDVYYTSDKTVTEVRYSSDERIWENKKVTNFVINDNKRSFKIGQSLYYYDESTQVYSAGEPASIGDLCEQDQLIVRGIEQKIASVVVDKGHGYVTLDNAKYFYGGYIDFGGQVIKVIEKDMLIIVPEGNYKVEAKNGSYFSQKLVTVARNEQVVIDYSDVPPIVIENGNVKFNIDVSGATLYIDGVVTDYTKIITIPCGKHTIRVEAEGYNTFSKRIDVGLDYLVMDISLANGASNTEAATQTTTQATEQETTAVKSNYSVTIKAASGSIIYVDGSCKGLAPAVFDLVSGNHVITVMGVGGISNHTVEFVDGKDIVLDYTK